MNNDRANLMTELRSEMLLEGTKGLVLVNGGGAVALATWLQAVFEKSWAVPMLWWHVSAMLCFAAGVAFAALVHLTRYVASLHPNSTHPLKNPGWWVFMGAGFFSIISFAMAATFIAVGAFKAIDALAPPVTTIPTQTTQTKPTLPSAAPKNATSPNPALQGRPRAGAPELAR